MKKETKTDESIKAGMKIEGDTKPQNDIPMGTGTGEFLQEEKDEDELVHERAGETPDVTDEKDMDELSHEVKPVMPGENAIIDPDDAVHGK